MEEWKTLERLGHVSVAARITHTSSALFTVERVNERELNEN